MNTRSECSATSGGSVTATRMVFAMGRRRLVHPGLGGVHPRFGTPARANGEANLVAMEGPLLNRRGGVLVLSRNAGAYWRLGKHAIAVNPFDLRETAEALFRALEMPREERVRRARGLSRLVWSNPPERWVRTQLEDLDRARIRRRVG